MVFSFRLRKKKGDDSSTLSGGSASSKNSGSSRDKASALLGSKKKSTRRPPNDFNSPLVTIDETAGGTNKTVPATPVMSNVKVVENPDGGTEIVFGEEGLSSEENNEESDFVLEAAATKEPEFALEEGPEKVEDVKKKLFAEEDDVVKTAAAATAAVTTAPEVVDEALPQFDEPFDEPFDEKQMKKEDPYMIELMQTESYDEAERAMKKQQLQKSRAIPKMEEEEFAQGGIQDVANNFMEVFACNGDTTMFYDTLCADPRVKKRKRPYFNEEFAINFIKEATEEGIPMLYHVPPTNPVDNDWTGQSMEMYIRPGDCNGSVIMHPSLVWGTAAGGYSRLQQVHTFSVGLMDIHAIMDSMDSDADDQDEEGLFFFSVTTNSGEVHLFECPTEDERDRLVAGIKNVIARMSFSLVTGDDVVMAELYGGDEEEEGELPSLRTPHQEMGTVSHEFLDSVAPGVIPKRTASARIQV
eukprot:CAMPEP_0119005240 /NCGR_PEP_ID=MMETSP1176-20130426/1606_1 /TAXON_ID=265551 /ORGANISM="Synedropsis recta cf, Strain CCMP1620" /LENGTH=469 /DNA_ID=CAMNT_0006957027 /DNA_START=15 /DNA_END=1424 /DNA_ORIENTATION=-